MSLLVVEDEEDVRTMVAEFLRDEGYDVVEAMNAAEANLLLTSDPAGIEFVVTDVRMPGAESGLQFANHVRQNYPKIPVLLASGNVTDQEVAGHPYIMKPFKLDQLASKIREMLAESPSSF